MSQRGEEKQELKSFYLQSFQTGLSSSWEGEVKELSKHGPVGGPEKVALTGAFSLLLHLSLQPLGPG